MNAQLPNVLIYVTSVFDTDMDSEAYPSLDVAADVVAENMEKFGAPSRVFMLTFDVENNRLESCLDVTSDVLDIIVTHLESKGIDVPAWASGDEQ